MKHKNTYIIAIIITVLLATAFIVAGSFYSLIDVTKILENKLSENNKDSWTNIQGHDFEVLKTTIKNPISLSFFLFGIGGIDELKSTSEPFKLIVFTITSIIIIPTLLIVFFLYMSVIVILFSIQFMKRNSEVNKFKNVGKFGMYVSFILTFLFAFIGIIIFCSVQKSLHKNYQGFENYDSFSIMTFLIYLSKGTVFNWEKNGLLNDSSIITTLNVGLVFLFILFPISSICLIVFSSMYIAIFIEKKDNRSSKFFNWLKNIRIDSLKEYIQLNIRSPWIWILSITFVFTIIIHGFIHPYTNITQILITLVSILIIPIAFSPMIIGYIMAKKIKRFNYNRLMFIQILLLTLIIFLIQLNTSIFLKDYMFKFPWLSAFLPLITCTLSLFATFGFIKFSDK
ncbi:motility-associated protein Scm1 [Spiroplasma endosymbiont of Atherix ibis]|uniref:motility-associated protein Scm1 n=1 Tax=Spiroplasma endosymbiont of Atherix ibis TaxID=3066291 RepID=UPI0030CDA995